MSHDGATRLQSRDAETSDGSWTGERHLCPLTCVLPQLLTQADVGELQHLLPFLALSFSVPSTSCKKKGQIYTSEEDSGDTVTAGTPTPVLAEGGFFLMHKGQ